MRITENNIALNKAGIKITCPRIKILKDFQNHKCLQVSTKDVYKKLINMNKEIRLAKFYHILN
uniref:transcriptional repressor n=1 Tax=Sodalis endosymbiont of Henestaris halophilus TaxID=1929246 RepID=UPI000BE253A3|nr:transcriptional repressor [Sodalis endosymbiont of Henestaris halophilus]